MPKNDPNLRYQFQDCMQHGLAPSRAADSFALLLMFATAFLQKTTNRVHEMVSIETCLPENADNKSALDLAITDPDLAIIWARTNITGVTTHNVTYVLEMMRFIFLTLI
jgi:hypothetical protein